MTALWRLIVIMFAGVVASFAAGLVVTVAVLVPAWNDLALGALDDGVIGMAAGFGAVVVSGLAFLPALIVVVIAEAFSIRSVIYYAVAGGLVGAALYLSFRNLDTLDLTANAVARRELEIIAAAGIVAGFVYWMIAGRNAGRWSPAPPALPQG